MPIYCFQCDECGRRSEIFRHTPLTDAVMCGECGEGMRRDWSAEASRPRAAECGEIRSLAAGVMPQQASAAEQQLHARGIGGVRFDPRTGDALFANRPARLKAIKAMGLRDRDEIRG